MPGGGRVSLQHQRHDVLLAAARVAALVGELLHQAQAGTTRPRLVGGGRGARRAPGDRVERPALVGDLERRGALVHARAELDPVLARVVVGMADDVSQQLGRAELQAPDVLGLDRKLRAEPSNPVTRAPDGGEFAGQREPARRLSHGSGSRPGSIALHNGWPALASCPLWPARSGPTARILPA
jgi:hypothetical protein